MARSSREQMDRNRERILVAACGLFRSVGYDAVGIAEVMKAAGMTQGGFYKHFASKEALAAEAWRYGFARAVEAWMEKAKAGRDEGKPALEALVAYYFAPKPPERTCPMVSLGQDAVNHRDCSPLQNAYGEGARAMYDAFMATGSDGSQQPSATMKQLFAAMIGANFLARATGGAPWAADLCDTVLSDTASNCFR